MYELSSLQRRKEGEMEEENRPRGQGFESVGEILSRPHGNGASRSLRTEECDCATCGQKFQGEVIVYNFAGAEREWRPKECESCRQAREKEEKRLEEEELAQKRGALRTAWRNSCGIPAVLQLRTFDNFQEDLQPSAIKRAREWAEGLVSTSPFGYPSLFF